VGLRILGIAACAFPCRRGTPSRVRGQLDALAGLGHEVHLATYHLEDGRSPDGLRVHRIPRVPTFHSLEPGPTPQKIAVLDPLLFGLTLGLARRLRPHVLHAHHLEAGLVALAVRRLTGVPVIFDAHTLVSEELPLYPIPLPRGWMRTAGALLEGFVARAADHTLCVSEPLRAQLLELAGGRLGVDRISVVPTGNDAHGLLPAERRRPRGGSDEARAGFRIVYAGSLAGFQGMDLLRNAFALVRATAPDARLEIVTADPPARLPSPWREDPAAHGVELVQQGSLRELFRRLVEADVAVAPRSAPGGLPQKVLNYMAAGLPVVACAASAPSLEHARTGLVVADDDHEGFAAAVLRLLRDADLRRRLGEAARKQADSLEWPALAREITTLYHRVLRGASTS
jgi:glycosyltransferase involved in cell wall biosynthesis